MPIADQPPPRLHTVVDHGGRFSILVIADGYRDQELELFAGRVDAFSRVLLRTPPFDLLGRLVTVHRLDISTPDGSSELGAAFVDEAARLLTIDQQAALDIAAKWLASADMVVVQCNVDRYGGSGGSVAVFSAHPKSVGIALHEMGHTAFGLGDEYDYPPHDDEALEVHHPERHPGPEPRYPNLTVNTDWDALKWRHLAPPGTPLPTTDPSVALGAFEGGDYHRRGVYRPSFDCAMRTIGAPFCPVCQQAIRRVLLLSRPPT